MGSGVGTEVRRRCPPGGSGSRDRKPPEGMGRTSTRPQGGGDECPGLTRTVGASSVRRTSLSQDCRRTGTLRGRLPRRQGHLLLGRPVPSGANDLLVPVLYACTGPAGPASRRVYPLTSKTLSRPSRRVVGEWGLSLLRGLSSDTYGPRQPPGRPPPPASKGGVPSLDFGTPPVSVCTSTDSVSPGLLCLESLVFRTDRPPSRPPPRRR